MANRHGLRLVMRILAAINGNLHKFMEEQKVAAEKAVTRGITEITTLVKNDLRAQVLACGLGNKLAKSWQGKVYPKGTTSIDAAGWVFSKAPKLIRAFDDGALIRSKNGNFLAVPTDAAPKRGTDGKRISPSNFPEYALGVLRFVYRKSGISLLVVDGMSASRSKRGGFRRASTRAQTSGNNVTTVVMFLLVPQVKLKKLLDYKSVAKRWKEQLATTILKHWPQEK